MNSIFDAASSPSVFSEMDLFAVPPTQVAVERTFDDVIRPMNTVTDDGPYEFSIMGNQYFLDMSANKVYMKLKITNEDGTDITGHIDGVNNEVGSNYGVPINLIGQTFFKQVKMYIGGKLVYDSGDNYPFLAYITTELNFSREVKDTFLTSAGYDKEWDETIQTSATLQGHLNPGFKEKFKRVRDSRFFELKSSLHFPLAHQDKYLLSGMDIRFELFRSSNQFALVTAGHNFKIHLEEIKLYIRKVELTQQLSLAVETALQRQPAKYPVRRMELKTLHINQGRLTTPENNIWSGQLPRRVVMCLVDTDSYYGSYGKNPFIFEHHGVEQVAIYVNGQCVPYSGPLNVQFRNRTVAGIAEAKVPDLVMNAYTQFYNALGFGQHEKSNGISLERFIVSACYFVFDLSQDNVTDKSSWELLRSGTLSVYYKFKKAVENDGIRVLILGEFDNLITINKNRDIEYDYTI